MAHDNFAEMTGLEVLQWIKNADLQDVPSIGRLLGMKFTEVDLGRVTVEVTTAPDFANPLGSVHGGIAATLLDSVMGCAVHTTLPAGVGYTTLELGVNYIRSVSTQGRTLTATGEIIHVGKTVATAQGKVHDDEGRLVAHATTTCLILNPRKDSGPATSSAATTAVGPDGPS
ncbi:thioesterase [Williamsia muralis]|uniref:Thioesterase n=2 Tax=Williamsia marianensis TaxID=85044 RepID=A0A2G3PRK2_WILMA|nr:thioesterase [Williamsia marianensis]